MKISYQTMIIAFCMLVSTTSFASPVDLNFNTNHWVNPVKGNMQTDTNYNYLSAVYQQNHKKQHVGVDIIDDLNTAVYAIADGRVVHIDRRSDEIKNLSKIYINHMTVEEIAFTAVYAHCKALPTLSENDRVIAGEKIGTITRFGSPDHLHFGINVTENLSLSHWGRLLPGLDAHQTGWRNPVSFLANHRPLAYRFEGCGSLISKDTEDKNCFGCNHDQTMIHPGSGKKSMASFQWQVSDRCKSVKISTNQDDRLSNEVNIRIGHWYTRNNDVFFSNIVLPFVLDTNNTGLPLKTDTFYTLNIGFDNFVENKTNVYAECTDESGVGIDTSSHYTNVQNDGLIQTSNTISKWTGNASVISQGCAGKDTWGCNKDIANIHPVTNGVQPEVYFQWQASKNCRSLRISSGPDQKNQKSTPEVEIMVKPWDIDPSACLDEKNSNCEVIKTRLPYTSKGNFAPDNGLYNVISVKFLEHVTQKQSVLAQCPGAW